MIEISLSKVVKNFGFSNILNGFDFEVTTGERVALIGPNGSGKTTVFNLIAGIEKADDGQVSIRKGANIGVLSQIPPKVASDMTVRDVIHQGLGELVALEKRMRVLEEKLSNSDAASLDSHLKDYGKLQDQFMQMGGYEIEEKVSRICTGFKISEDMLDRQFNLLSGGEKTIVNLASLVISNPDVLLLDEPTNHLDIETLEWFESFLKKYDGTVVIVSHDRYFLDRVATKTVLIDKGKSDIYHGNYSYFLAESERRALAEFEEYKNQQKMIEAMKKKIKQLKEWGVQGDNPRFFRRAASIEKKLEKIEALDRPDTKKSLPLEFDVAGRSGKDVLKIEDLGLILGDNIIFSEAELAIRYGDKVCLMGNNGSGKSTLIKTILGDLKPDTGEIKLGSSVTIGYIPQEITFDKPNASVLETARVPFRGTETQLRAALAKFLFYGENVFKRVGNLSGGEKVRLKLFELIQKRANLLILDEPTNHIDIDTREILEEALLDYPGTLLFVSHDRFFINKLAETVLHIEDQHIVEYVGNYSDYKNHVKRMESTEPVKGKKR